MEGSGSDRGSEKKVRKYTAKDFFRDIISTDTDAEDKHLNPKMEKEAKEEKDKGEESQSDLSVSK